MARLIARVRQAICWDVVCRARALNSCYANAAGTSESKSTMSPPFVAD